MSERTGGCVCGAVRFTAKNVPDKAAICHCQTCRRWLGSALIGVGIKREDLAWTGTEHIRERQTSHWAKRAWCNECGTGLYFEMTMESEWSGNQEVPIGIFDDPNGFTLASEIYIDYKPDSYAFAKCSRKVLTRAECVAQFEVLDED